MMPRSAVMIIVLYFVIVLLSGGSPYREARSVRSHDAGRVSHVSWSCKVASVCSATEHCDCSVLRPHLVTCSEVTSDGP